MGKHEGACPIATRALILKQAEKRGVSVNQCIQDYSEEAEIPAGTLREWVYPEQAKRKAEKRKVTSSEITTTAQLDPPVDNPLPDLGVVVKAIESGQVSNEEMMDVGDALAKVIKTGTAPPRVGSAVATAVKQAFKKGAPPPPKMEENFQRLWKHVLAAAEGLTICGIRGRLTDKALHPMLPLTESESLSDPVDRCMPAREA